MLLLFFPGEVDLTTHFSWTVITWVVVFGSTIVMLLWIVIYSFFLTKDFVDEVVILFGGITFWATVLLSASVALGKYQSSSVCLTSPTDRIHSSKVSRQVLHNSLYPIGQRYRERNVGHGGSQGSTWPEASTGQENAQEQASYPRGRADIPITA